MALFYGRLASVGLRHVVEENLHFSQEPVSLPKAPGTGNPPELPQLLISDLKGRLKLTVRTVRR